MPRPRLHRRIRFDPSATYFKPQGIPMRLLEVVNLSREELEAFRLKHVEDLDQISCAKKNADFAEYFSADFVISW